MRLCSEHLQESGLKHNHPEPLSFLELLRITALMFSIVSNVKQSYPCA
jgi:hypothetical protein